ncbi:peptidase S8, partial [Streptococcus pyogenes]
NPHGMVLPLAFISHEFGKAMSTLNGNGTGSLMFDSSLSKAPSQKGNEMNHFSNWGLTSDGYLKPDVTAPGGDIYSSYNDNHYGSQTGTSMAAPQIAGASLLIKQYLEQIKPDLPKDQVADLVKNIMMSNARVHVNPVTNVTTSPRQQGAGLLNLEAAVS